MSRTIEARRRHARAEAEAAFTRWQSATTDAELREARLSTQIWQQVLELLGREQGEPVRPEAYLRGHGAAWLDQVREAIATATGGERP